MFADIYFPRPVSAELRNVYATQESFSSCENVAALVGSVLRNCHNYASPGQYRCGIIIVVVVDSRRNAIVQTNFKFSSTVYGRADCVQTARKAPLPPFGLSQRYSVISSDSWTTSASISHPFRERGGPRRFVRTLATPTRYTR